MIGILYTIYPEGHFDPPSLKKTRSKPSRAFCSTGAAFFSAARCRNLYQHPEGFRLSNLL